MKVVKKKIDELKFSAYNPRQISVHDFNALKKSLAEFGLVEPIVVDEKNQIIGGHMRVRAAKELGWSEVDCIVVSGLSERQKKALNLALNRISGEWDRQKLAELLMELEGSEEFDLTGFDNEEITELFDEFGPGAAELDFEEPERDKVEIKAKRGDIYQLGEHRLMCGDSTSLDDVLKLMNGKKGQMVFTDPPYGVDYVSPSGYSYTTGPYEHESDVKTDKLKGAKYGDFVRDFLTNLYQVTDDKAPVFVCFANSNFEWVKRALQDAGYNPLQVIIWIKEHFVFSPGIPFHRCYEPILFAHKKNKKYRVNKWATGLKDVWTLDFEDFQAQLDAWYVRRDVTNEYVHPTQKPVRLVSLALRRCSQKGDIVIDLFGGSGSTLLACEQMGRVCYMMELDPYYVDRIIERWEALTGKKAKKIK